MMMIVWKPLSEGIVIWKWYLHDILMTDYHILASERCGFLLYMAVFSFSNIPADLLLPLGIG